MDDVCTSGVFTWPGPCPCEWHHGGSENGVIKEILLKPPSLEVLSFLQGRDRDLFIFASLESHMGPEPGLRKGSLVHEWTRDKVSLQPRPLEWHSAPLGILCAHPGFISGSLAGEIQE